MLKDKLNPITSFPQSLKDRLSGIKPTPFLTEETPLIKSATELREGTKEFAEPIVEAGLKAGKFTEEAIMEPGTKFAMPVLEKLSQQLTEKGYSQLGKQLMQVAPFIGLGVDIAAPIPGAGKKKAVEKGIEKTSDLIKGIKNTDKMASKADNLSTSISKAKASGQSWSELQKTNPDLFNTGILRKSQAPHKAVGEIPVEVHSAQYKWQNYGQDSEIPADVLYKRIDNGAFKGEYLDNAGFPVRDENGNILQDVYDDATGEWIKPNISNQQLKDNLLKQFETPEGKKYLSEVIDALPKNSDGSITAYRIGAIGGDGTQSYTLSEGMAKTFSNQGTVIMPAGTPGLPKGGYKDFGILPVNKVKIDPNGIKAWSPYDAEILVEPKFVKKLKAEWDGLE